MAVASRGAALSALRSMINHQPVPASTMLRRPYLPDGIGPSGDPARMTPESIIGGYGDEARYRIGSEDPATQIAVAGPPCEVLSGRPSITTDMVETYVKSSIDLTMQGGTTSGVVYPLAVCELATQYRFRNVGGASAGAIAAAITAAAELGRCEDVRHPETATAVPAPAGGQMPTIRRGFVGLTDIISWLTQTRPDDPERDEFRLAQLFRPPRTTHQIFRVLVAIMRHRTWPLPLIMLMAFGPITRVVAGLVLLATVVATGWIGARFVGQTLPWYAVLGWGLLDWAAFLASVTGALLSYQGIGMVLTRRNGHLPAGPEWLTRLRGFTSALTPRPASVLMLVVPGLVLLIFGITVGVLRPGPYLAAWLVGLAGSLILVGVLIRAALVYLRQFRTRSYGLVAGTTAHRKRDLLDVLAGMPKATVGPSLVPWLADCLNQLAGLPNDQVLRFGHLWAGRDFHLRRATAGDSELAAYRAMALEEDRRLMNLELMTTDLTRQRPYRFPLPPTARHDSDQLWLCLDDLRDGDSQLFPEPVMAALADGDPISVVDTGGRRLTLHPLPDPWDLPVIFAVRISMALPGLFQAVRMYRIKRPAPVQDDFGRTLVAGGIPLGQPAAEAPAAPEVAEELWFSDGGITSNFPVHFFDASLPRWPTVSLNLGGHPETAPHADVWLPQDWDVLTMPTATLSANGFSLVKAVFNTAMSWRDSMQSAMPGYRNRIAQVRTRGSEGGTNLFMSREVIASMALRGILAGARLRTRFSDDSQWNRFRWLRLRVAINNLERLRASTGERRGFYADMFTGPDWLKAQESSFRDKPVATQVPWYWPVDGFWPKAPRLLNTFVDAYRPDGEDANVMTRHIPYPEPVLRQIPRE